MPSPASQPNGRRCSSGASGNIQVACSFWLVWHDVGGASNHFRIGSHRWSIGRLCRSALQGSSRSAVRHSVPAAPHPVRSQAPGGRNWIELSIVVVVVETSTTELLNERRSSVVWLMWAEMSSRDTEFVIAPLNSSPYEPNSEMTTPHPDSRISSGLLDHIEIWVLKPVPQERHVNYMLRPYVSVPCLIRECQNATRRLKLPRGQVPALSRTRRPSSTSGVSRRAALMLHLGR